MKMLRNMMIVVLACSGASAMAMSNPMHREQSDFMKKRIAQYGGGKVSAPAPIRTTSLLARALNPKSAAVLIIDIQDDFTHPNSYKFDKTKDGSLAVANSGDDYVGSAIRTTQMLKKRGYKVFASQDYHPANHMSFASNHPGKKPFETMDIEIPLKDGGKRLITQMLWPNHCVQGTHGADILIPANLIDVVIQKGTHPDCDSYSAFEDDGGQDTGLNAKLNAAGIDTVLIYGIATDYCVRASALHAIKNGKKVYLVTDLCRGVDDAGSKKAIEEMQQAGVIIIKSQDL